VGKPKRTRRHDKIVDFQDRSPDIKERIDRVGVQGIRSWIKVVREGKEFVHVPIIDVVVDLEEGKKGIHMSRLTETIGEVLEQSTGICSSLEEFGDNVLTQLSEKCKYERAEIKIKTTLLIDRAAPKSGKNTLEPYEATVTTIHNNKPMKDLEVGVVGSTSCPHSIELSGGNAHIQRAKVTLGLLTDFSTQITLEELVTVSENSMSAPSFTVLKAKDEKYIVELQHSNPRFVEDVVRGCFEELKKTGVKGKVRIKVVSDESIHKHNAVAEIIRVLN
jgi:GTP cyclohydrolase-4